LSGFRRLPNWIKIPYVIIALFSIFAALNLSPILRIGGPGGVWLYIQPRFGGLLASAIGLAIYGYGAFLLLKHPKKLLLWAFCGSVLLPVLMLTIQGSLGFPLAALGIWRIFRASRRESIADLFSLTFGTMFSILVFSILARGETGRVWIFLMPYWLLLASDVLAHLPSIQQNRILPHLLLLQTICLIVPGGFFWSSFTALTEPARPTEAGNPAIPVNARFSNGTDTFTLTGLNYQVNAGKIQLRLVWRADTWIRNPIELSILPIADDGTIAGKLNYTPLDRQYPPACWTPGRPFEDIVLLPLERKSESWLYSISAWDINANKALMVNDNQTQVGIGPIVMPKN